MPPHVDGHFVGHAGHKNVMLVFDPESRRIHRAHHACLDECNVRTMDGEKLTMNAALLQDFPPAACHGDGELDPTKVRLTSPDLSLTTQHVDPTKSVTISVLLPHKSKPLGLVIKDDFVFGFPVLHKVQPASPLRTQIPHDLHRNCWIVAINSLHRGCDEPIAAEHCANELKSRQLVDKEAKVELAFHRKEKPILSEHQTL